MGFFFNILKLLFLSIFCRYIRYFVGTNDMLVGLHVPTYFQMYRQILKCTDKTPKKHYCPPPPPPPPLATLMNTREYNTTIRKNMTESLWRSSRRFEHAQNPRAASARESQRSAWSAKIGARESSMAVFIIFPKSRNTFQYPLSKRVCKRLSKRLSRVVAFIIELYYRELRVVERKALSLRSCIAQFDP